MFTNLYLDTRYASLDGTSMLKLSFSKHGKCALISLGIKLRPGEWDGSKVVNRPDKNALNAEVLRQQLETDRTLTEMKKKPGWDALTAAQVRDFINKKRSAGDPELFVPSFNAFMQLKVNPTTRSMYASTLAHLKAFDPELEFRSFREITVEYLTRFENHLALTAPSKNSRNIHLRNIRAVFNAAIDEEKTTFYPFRRFKIKPQRTAHRALSVENLRTLFNYPVEPYAQQYLDMFKLMFFLMGINIVDLYNLKTITPDGRVEFNRAKTKRFYSMKVEPEALEIINRYRGERHLLRMADDYANYRDYAHHMNDALQKIGPFRRAGRGGKKTVEPLFPKLTTYWARHTWATVAASLDIPKETIAAGLGHGGNSVTDIYIDFDQTKVDRANRKVIDWVLYGRR